jgi:surface-anchored protein
MDRVDRGVRLSLLGVQGPGRLSVYLQSGAFGPPEVLWRSDRVEPQSIWVDLNTHTHANWVFTRPGAYLVRVEVAADLVDGSTERAVADLRFAVGDATDPQQALSLESGAALAAAGSSPDASRDAGAGEPAGAAGSGTGAAGGGSTRTLWWAAGLGAGLLIVSVAAAARGARHSRRVAMETGEDSSA